MEKSERIAAKRAELEAVLSDLSDEQRKLAADLIGQAAFLSVTLEDLNESITRDGTTEEYTNGRNQAGRKVSSDAKLYAQLIARYSGIVTKLMKFAPTKKYIVERETPEDLAERFERKTAEDVPETETYSEWCKRNSVKCYEK